MINKQNNLMCKLYLYFLFLTILFSCKNREHLIFQNKEIATRDVIDCEAENCAIINISLLEAVNKNKVSKMVNQQIERIACEILNIENNKPVKTIEEAITGFNTSYQQLKEEFPNEITPYEANIDCQLSFQNNSILSILIEAYTYTGGAHGNGNSSYLTIDPKTGQPIDHNSLFKNHTALLDYAEKFFREKYTIPEKESINSTGFFFENDQFSLPSNIGITDHHVILFYNQYEISSYSDGPVELKIEKEKVANFFFFEIL